MAERAVREHDGKFMLSKLLPSYVPADTSAEVRASIALPSQLLQITLPASGHAADVDYDALAAAAPWVHTTRLVCKPDQLIKRRGKGGLLLLNADWAGVVAWVRERLGTTVTVDGVSGPLTTFLVEPFVPHASGEEYYVCITTHRAGEDILFTAEGGVDVGDVDAKALRMLVPIGAPTPTAAAIADTLLGGIPSPRRPLVASFIAALYAAYMDAHYVYLEVNPLVVTTHPSGTGALMLAPLDLAAKVDEAAAFLASDKWNAGRAAGNPLTFPPPFGRQPEPEEAYIRDLDAKTGSSLKLTILNRKGRVWTMVAGGGASVVYADTISDYGYGPELANYGEYSGAPSEEQTYEYAKTILKLMGAERLPAGSGGIPGKVLIIGGGIANFTDVAKTFTGIIRALREAAAMLRDHGVTVWVRRGGPNYQEGLKLMADLGGEIGVPIHVYGPDTHITAIVPLALGITDTSGLIVAEERGGRRDAAADDAAAVLARASPSSTASSGVRVTAAAASAGAAATASTTTTTTAVGGPTPPVLVTSASGSALAKMVEATAADAAAAATTPAAIAGARALGAAVPVGGAGTAAGAASAGRPVVVASGIPINRAASIMEASSYGGVSSPSHASPTGSRRGSDGSQIPRALPDSESEHMLFHPGTRSIVYGMQTRAVQGMLDFDWLCKRDKPSVAAIVFPFSGNHYQQFYFGHSQVMIPVYTTTDEAMRRHTDVTVFVNFASFRSVYPSTMEALAHAPRMRTVAIIAEGVPEQQARRLTVEAEARGVTIIGPATVGGITPGCFRIGNTGGMLDNIISCRLYRPGSVGYVSKSGGMSNELNNIMATYADGVAEGVAIGGDRYPGSRFIDHLLRYEANPRVKMHVLLGEVGGVDEYDVAAAIADGRIKKPLVAWCIGTCASLFPFEVQFGHAGALANSTAQTAAAKNAALKAAGAIVPSNFNTFVSAIRDTYTSLAASGTITVVAEPPPPRMPMDYAWARQLGLIRKPSSFVSSISDDRGEELLYAGVPISRVFEENLGVGGVLSLLWFRRRLPAYATRFIEMVLMVTADHGPAVSGAHNTIVTARAGKDLISALCSGLLTIGPRFGGALDDAAAQFTKAYDAGQAPAAFVAEMRASNRLISGIGHRVKSLTNPDKRVTIIKDYALANFPSCDVLKYALQVEVITTGKKENLILNVDGAIAVCFADLLRSCGCFTREEADETLANGCLNGLFVVGRSIGFIGHYLDQVRLKQGLYRHPTDDITYMMDGAF